MEAAGWEDRRQPILHSLLRPSHKLTVYQEKATIKGKNNEVCKPPVNPRLTIGMLMLRVKPKYLSRAGTQIGREVEMRAYPESTK